MDDDLRQLHGALMDLVGVLNRPEPDARLLREAGVKLDRALFPLLVRIGARGPKGRAGRWVFAVLTGLGDLATAQREKRWSRTGST